MKKNDIKILADIKQGSENAFIELYNQNYPQVERLILKNSGTIDDAKDIFQDTIHVLLVKIRSDNFELSASINTYIYGISKNLWLKRLRDVSRSKEIKLDNLLTLNDFYE